MKWETKIICVVDDKRIFINMNSNEMKDTHIAMKYLQQSSQYWEHLLYTAGGKLQYSKCVFYVIEQKFKDDGTTTMNENIYYTLPITSCEIGYFTE